MDALIGAIVVVFFFLGLLNGSVSSFNIGIWIVGLVVLTIIIGGGLWLKVVGYPVFAIVLLLVLAIPGLIYGLFILLVMISKTPWR